MQLTGTAVNADEYDVILLVESDHMFLLEIVSGYRS